MDKIREKLSNLKLEAESWQEKYEELKEKNKDSEQETVEKENLIKSLTVKNQQLEEEIEKLEAGLTETKQTEQDNVEKENQIKSLAVKNSQLEDEIEKLEAELAESSNCPRTRTTCSPTTTTTPRKTNSWRTTWRKATPS